jgi:hypothetical protein
MKRKALMVLLCVLLLGALAGSAQAGDWYTCNVNWAGTSGTVYFVQLTEASGAHWTGARYYLIDSSQSMQNAMLATALTAWASGQYLNVFLNNIGEWNTTSAVAVYNPAP